MNVKIYDAQGNERDYAWMAARYGKIEFLDGGNGPKFALTALRETQGPASIIVSVRRPDGTPHNGQPVANHWPGIEMGGCVASLNGGGLKTLYRDIACVQRTDGNEGSTGFGIGGGSYYWPPNDGIGPHTIWVLSPSLPSDGVRGLGMLPMTDHHGMLRAEFTLIETAQGGGTTPPPPPPPLTGSGLDLIGAALASIADSLKRLTDYITR